MLASWQSDITTVTRLRVRSNKLDPLSAQLRLTCLLNIADWHPADLSPYAILCIRKLRDPMPGALPLHGNNIGLPQKWERAVNASLEQLARRAARPALGAVPANAEAVLFADRAELLACLARDYCAGNANAHWWWQSLLRSKDISRALLTAWLEAPEYVPGALQLLSESGSLAAFVRTLHDEAANAITQSLLQRFALFELQSALAHEASVYEAGLHENQTAATSAPAHNRSLAPLWGAVATANALSPTMPHKGAGPHAPWQQWAPEGASSEWRFERQCLLGIGLMLQRAPSVVRSRSFAHAVREWQQATLAAAERVPATTEQHTAKIQTEPQDFTQSLETPLAPRSSLDEQLEEANPQMENATALFAPRSSLHAATPINTAYGGVFYLINLGIFLELYGDFTVPLQPGIDLSIWDFVALLGEEFCGEKIKADPIWPLLAQLAGREEHEAPGKNFSPPEEWRLPAAWLKPFPETGVWQWSSVGGRLRVEHHEEFCVLDIALEENVSAKLQYELQAYAAVTGFELQHIRGFAEETNSNQFERWMNWLMPYVRARLLRALGMASAEDLPHILCEHHARLFVTPTHLDVELSLAELPIALRLAGLDRNPGWVPATGKFIAFHFE